MRKLLRNEKVRETVSEIGTCIMCGVSFAVFMGEIFKWMMTTV